MTAFPPAEQIAAGRAATEHLRPRSCVQRERQAFHSDESELPNVTGALVDSCGNLVGVSLADDVQSMESSPATRYQWRDTLLLVFTEMQSHTPMNLTAPAKTEEPRDPSLNPKLNLNPSSRNRLKKRNPS